jgi:hypothetical protein
MFEEVTGEYGVQEIIIERPPGGAILLKQADVLGRVVRRGGIQIHAILLGACDVVDELAISAAEIQNPIGRPDPPREEVRGKGLPDSVSIIQIPLKPPDIDLLQISG